jgi:hypothetical protein
MVAKKDKKADLAKKIRENEQLLEKERDEVSNRESALRGFKEKYREAIGDELADTLRSLTWSWPTSRRGLRVAEAQANRNHPIIELLKPLRSSPMSYYRIEVGDTGAFVTVKDPSYCNNYSFVLRFDSAKKLGIVNPLAKKNWSKIKKRLEAAGLTDENALEAALQKLKEEKE